MKRDAFDIFQVAYVATDLEQAMRVLGGLYGTPQFQVNRDVAIETAAGTAQAHFALAFLGDRQLEIIQPAGGADATYREPLPPSGFALRLHHLGRLITDEHEWQQVRGSIVERGYAMPVDGVYRHEGVALMHYVYADTRRELGHYLEYMYQTEAGRDLFVQVPRF